MGLLSRAEDKSPEEQFPPENETLGEIPEAAPETNALEEEIAQYHETNAAFHCLVFEHPASAGEDEKAGFCKKVSEMIHKTGVVIPLSLNRPLILLPGAMDRELIAHRISKSLKATPLLSFEADSPENALGKLQSLL